MKTKTLLVGQAPAKGGNPRKPLLGVRSAKRLQELCGMSPAEYEEAFDRANLLNIWPGKAGKGDKFDAVKAGKAAWRMVPKLHKRRVVLLGKNVAKAFNCEDMPLMVWEHRGGWKGKLQYECEVAVLPHPSGVNRWWNNPKNYARARAFLLEAASQEAA